MPHSPHSQTQLIHSQQTGETLTQRWRYGDFSHAPPGSVLRRLPSISQVGFIPQPDHDGVSSALAALPARLRLAIKALFLTSNLAAPSQLRSQADFMNFLASREFRLALAIFDHDILVAPDGSILGGEFTLISCPGYTTLRNPLFRVAPAGIARRFAPIITRTNDGWRVVVALDARIGALAAFFARAFSGKLPSFASIVFDVQLLHSGAHSCSALCTAVPSCRTFLDGFPLATHCCLSEKLQRLVSFLRLNGDVAQRRIYCRFPLEATYERPFA